MARSTTPKTGLGEKLRIVRKANSGAGFGALTDFSLLKNHGPKIGLLSTVAIPIGDLRQSEGKESLTVAGGAHDEPPVAMGASIRAGQPTSLTAY